MSIHLQTAEYICKNCKTKFITYIKGLECPRCETKEESQNEDAYRFVDSQVWSMMMHKRRYRQFTPFSWSTTSYCDQVQWSLFRIFDNVYKNPNVSFEDSIKGQEFVDGEGKKFANDKHLLDLILAINKKIKVELEEYEKELEREAIKKEEEKERKKLKNRIKIFFKF